MSETDLENEQPITPKEAHDILCDILLDNPTVVKVNDKSYEIKQLRLASKLMISKLFHEIKMLSGNEDEKEDDIIMMYKAIVDGTQAFENIVKIAAICINNHKFKAFDNEYNTKLINDTVEQLMFDTNVENQNELIKIVEASVKHLIDLKAVFHITSLVQLFSNALIQQRMIIKEQLKSVPKPFTV